MKRKTNIYIIGLLIGWLTSCSVTKNLPEEEILYTGIKKIEVVEQDSTEAGENTLTEIRAALDYPPNNALLGNSSVRLPFPFGLWMYNALIHKKGKLGKWMFDKLAAKPVLITNVNPEVRVKVAQNLLKEYGYFRGNASYELIPNPKDPKQAKIQYTITMRKPYTYDSIRYMQRRHRTDTIVRSNKIESLLHKGDNFNVVQLEAERQRISSLLRNNGYYYFRPEYITYHADTTRNPGKVSLRIVPSSGMPREALRLWKIGDITVALNGYNNELPTDTMYYNGLRILYEGKLRVRPAVLYRKLQFKEGDRYSFTKQGDTQTGLSRLGIFKYTEIQYTPKDTTRRCDTLDVRINTAYDLPLDGELEFNVTTKSNDQTGPGAIFSVTRRNIFGGGEVFGVQLKGSYEWQTGKRVGGKSSLMNSYEMGISSTLTLPQLLFQYPDEKISAIDADITRIGDKYHMFYVSHDGGAGIKQAVSDRVNSDYEYNARWYDPEPTACEAPNLWKRIGEDRWVLMYDVYGQKVHNFGFSETSDFVHFTPLGQFNQGVMRTTNFTSPKHGAIIHLTRQEAERLAEHWGMSYDALLPSE